LSKSHKRTEEPANRRALRVLPVRLDRLAAAVEQLEQGSADAVFLVARGDPRRALRRVVAEAEQKRLQAGKRQARAAGRYPGGKRPPFGYTVDDTGQLRSVPAEQRVIRRIRKLRARGDSLRAISEAVGLHPEQIRRIVNRP
jgi:hypothetical protein